MIAIVFVRVQGKQGKLIFRKWDAGTKYSREGAPVQIQNHLEESPEAMT